MTDYQSRFEDKNHIYVNGDLTHERDISSDHSQAFYSFTGDIVNALDPDYLDFVDLIPQWNNSNITAINPYSVSNYQILFNSYL